jgi:hypothetical protein
MEPVAARWEGGQAACGRRGTRGLAGVTAAVRPLARWPPPRRTLAATPENEAVGLPVHRLWQPRPARAPAPRAAHVACCVLRVATSPACFARARRRRRAPKRVLAQALNRRTVVWPWRLLPSPGAAMYELVRIGNFELIGEIIRLEGACASADIARTAREALVRARRRTLRRILNPRLRCARTLRRAARAVRSCRCCQASPP